MALPASGTPAASSSHALAPSPDKYRGAVVEDLQLPPAFCLPSEAPVQRGIEQAYERDFSQIPVLSRERRVLGYLDVVTLKKKWEAGELDPNATVASCMTRFDRRQHTPYAVITPDTPLEELETFLQANLFALVTDRDRKFVLGVATLADVQNFLTRRGM